MRDIVHVQGDRIRLVPLDEELHLENYLRWLNDPEVARYLNRTLPLTRVEEEGFFRQMAVSKDAVVWAVHDEADRHIGGTGLHAIDWQARSAVSGTIIGDKQVWNRGYGTDIMRTRTRWAFEDLGLHRIESESFVENVASAKCLERAGYRQIGIARQRRWRNGVWHDCNLWEILDEDYFAGRDDEGRDQGTQDQGTQDQGVQNQGVQE